MTAAGSRRSIRRRRPYGPPSRRSDAIAKDPGRDARARPLDRVGIVTDLVAKGFPRSPAKSLQWSPHTGIRVEPRRFYEGAPLPTGTVKFFNSEKGYGFISRSDGEDVFVHFSNIEGTGRRDLEAGQQVEFEVGPGRKGDEARNVRVI